MKKKIILGVLFLLPVSIVLILLFTTHNYTPLPVIKMNVSELVNYDSIEERDIQFEGKITILGFLGNNVKDRKINVLNLNQKIYKRFSGFKHFQLVMLVTPGQREEIEELKFQISRFADELKSWNFVEVDDRELTRIFEGLDSPLTLDQYNSSDFVYIIDKDKNLRGRFDDRSKTEIQEEATPYMLYGYNTTLISELSGKMTDDIRILFEEYRGKSKKEQSQDRRKEIIEVDKNEK
ncbi:hypothetical protein U8527_03770 [Kordia algicida OT-1]|uniref:Membrane or secreted protein n=1 Tax=Kordia algicida OT-1 TaxID=391587 RepID=A9DPI1_9FLAO|nr:hypothetical protein [Kordia algicida]EDP97440.1 hypothetical protein KAOT1_19797 [Kordia algicida OT-1]